MPELNRITVDPEVMGGKPCIRGMRVTRESLETGALITIEAARLRTRILPLKKRS